jgi:hypothetical protein
MKMHQLTVMGHRRTAAHRSTTSAQNPGHADHISAIILAGLKILRHGSHAETQAVAGTGRTDLAIHCSAAISRREVAALVQQIH